jgi:cytochrome P450
MKYLSWVIKEGMRIFGPANGVSRVVMQDTQVGDVFIPKDSRIYLNYFALHFSEEFYEKPFEFRPERFETMTKQNYTWMPFSAGARVCMGNNFSLLEQKIFLAEVINNFEFSLENENDTISRDSKFSLMKVVQRNLLFKSLN